MGGSSVSIFESREAEAAAESLSDLDITSLYLEQEAGKGDGGIEGDLGRPVSSMLLLRAERHLPLCVADVLERWRRGAGTLLHVIAALVHLALPQEVAHHLLPLLHKHRHADLVLSLRQIGVGRRGEEGGRGEAPGSTCKLRQTL